MHTSLPRPWPTPTEAAKFAHQLRAAATLEAQADTQDPAFAVETLLWMAENYERSDR